MLTLNLRFSPSHLKTHFECPEKAHLQRLGYAVPSLPPLPSLRVGYLVHQGIAAWWRNDDLLTGMMESRLKAQSERGEMYTDQEFALSLAVTQASAQRFEKPDWVISHRGNGVAIEHHLECDLGHGYIDAVLQSKRETLFVEYKTKGINHGVFDLAAAATCAQFGFSDSEHHDFAQFQFDPQVQLYWELGRANYENFGGILLVFIVKPDTRATEKDKSEGYNAYMERTRKGFLADPRHLQWKLVGEMDTSFLKKQILLAASEVEMSERIGHFHRNFQACTDYKTGWRCPGYFVCRGAAPITSLPIKGGELDLYMEQEEQ